MTLAAFLLVLADGRISADQFDNEGCALIELDTLKGTERLLEQEVSFSRAQRAAIGLATHNSCEMRSDMKGIGVTIFALFAKTNSEEEVL
jgi:hypothetical protein